MSDLYKINKHLKKRFQNDLENVLPFVMISAMYITTNPDLSCAKLVFRAWTLARYIHTLVYVFQVSQFSKTNESTEFSRKSDTGVCIG